MNQQVTHSHIVFNESSGLGRQGPRKQIISRLFNRTHAKLYVVPKRSRTKDVHVDQPIEKISLRHIFFGSFWKFYSSHVKSAVPLHTHVRTQTNLDKVIHKQWRCPVRPIKHPREQPKPCVIPVELKVPPLLSHAPDPWVQWQRCGVQVVQQIDEFSISSRRDCLWLIGRYTYFDGSEANLYSRHSYRGRLG